MGIKFIDRFYRPQRNIFASHHKMERAYYVAQGSNLAVTVGDKKIIYAGTIYPSNDANAIGVISNDYDITDGDANIAVCIHGMIKECNIPVSPSNEARNALKGAITFVNASTSDLPSISTIVSEVAVGSKEFVAELLVSNDAFRPIAENPAQFSVNANKTGAVLSSVDLRAENRIAVLRFKCTNGLAAGEIRVKPLTTAVASGMQHNELVVARVVAVSKAGNECKEGENK